MTRGLTGNRIRAAVLAAGAVVGVATTLIGAPAADAAPHAAPHSAAKDCSTAYLGPQNAGPTTGNYFNLKVAAGEHLTEHLVAANPTHSRCQVNLQRAFGKTALNSGDTYVSVGDSCTGVACWLSNLPKSISLPPDSRTTVPFDVVAPQGAKPGEYLAGVVGQPNVAADSPNSRNGVRVQVRTRVAIGVAVTVAGALSPALRIPTVTVDRSQAPYASTVAITEQNGGNTWEHPKGSMTIQVGGKTSRFSVVSNTILGGGGVATLRAAAGRITGTHHARVVLWYDNHTKQAVWEGMLTFPALATVHKHGNQIVVARPASSSVPVWAWIAIGAAALMFALVLALLLVLWRRRKGDDDGSSTDTPVSQPIEPAPAV